MDTQIAFWDWIVLSCYILLIIAIGILSGKQEKSITDYFLGGRAMPWLAVMLSIYATSLSALTFIGVPGASFSGDFHYLQLGFGDLAGRLLVAYLLLKPFYLFRVTTVYQLLGQRFGPRSHDLGTALFMVTRILASGVRLAGCALALSVVFDISFHATILFVSLAAFIYTSIGGIKAVIWTDTVQFILFISAALVSLWFIISSLPNGFSDFINVGNLNEKFKVFHVSFTRESKDYWLNLNNPNSLLAGFTFGCVSTLAALGTDQDLVQRMLTCEKVGDSQKALISTAIINFPVTILFLSLGSALFVYYSIFPDLMVTGFVSKNQADKIFPYFIATIATPGIKGLLIAGLLAAAMSSLDSALNALASTACVDLWQRYFPSLYARVNVISVSRVFVFFFSVILAVIAMVFGKTESILWLGFRIVGYTYGGLLGLMLLAVLTKNRGNDLVNIICVVTSIFTVIFFTSESIGPFESLRNRILFPFGIEKLAWPWSIVIGTVWTMGFGVIFPTKKSWRTINECP